MDSMFSKIMHKLTPLMTRVIGVLYVLRNPSRPEFPPFPAYTQSFFPIEEHSIFLTQRSFRKISR
jgi:hypothetical protein